MKRRNLIQKVFLGGTALALLVTVLNSCSKKEEEEATPTNKTITIDLSAAKYSSLLATGGTYLIDSLNIKIVNTGNTIGSGAWNYLAARNFCTQDQGSLNYVPPNYYWQCSTCPSSFEYTGTVRTGPATTPLKVYAVGKAGNILTIIL
jgi:Rieske Fe-S protein